MGNIEALVPGISGVDTAGLSRYDADELARYAADPGNPWWRRRACAVALAGRVPQRWVAELLARVRDPDDTAEVRAALLDLFPDRTELLPWLRHEDRQHEQYGMPAAFLKARGMLGDRTATAELVTLAASPWSRWQALGEAGLDGLVARHGVAEVLGDVGDRRPEDRAFRVRMRHRLGEDGTDALADPDRSVAYLAQSLLTDPNRLRDHLDRAPTTEAKLWAAYALYNLTEDVTETRAIYDRLGRPRVDVPGLDDELRAAIVHEYAPGCERHSDPRWRIEALCTEPPARPDQQKQLDRAMAALGAAGFAPQSPVYCGDAHQQGDGTYHVVKCGEVEVFISTLGRFATAYDAAPAVPAALDAAGLRWIDEATAAIRVTDLCVYYFGDRNPLTVDTLLFYWQD
ncbi:hypothetical protein [Plantactinospora endophytica]|uniref:HEAT repeat domain-containing protein n=1 Tax=Plantactinospora endophytica TaxID=673535 RepID=A0ABQ4DUW4_9ACTN|nr:hypothetical protein [Plantactinospora endophytica]GIG86240.1 hypothetical protein Pen02_11760 [Plantactinospora endophytica]